MPQHTNTMQAVVMLLQANVPIPTMVLADMRKLWPVQLVTMLMGTAPLSLQVTAHLAGIAMTPTAAMWKQNRVHSLLATTALAVMWQKVLATAQRDVTILKQITAAMLRVLTVRMMDRLVTTAPAVIQREALAIIPSIRTAVILPRLRA